MKITDVQSLVELRTKLIEYFNTLRDYKNNKNAIMKEVDHARILSETIEEIDDILKGHVDFK